MRKIKLIWDFRSPDAAKIAEHHLKHLREYVTTKKVDCELSGVEDISEMYSLAFVVVNESDMKPIRDALRPHRGQVYEEG